MKGLWHKANLNFFNRSQMNVRIIAILAEPAYHQPYHKDDVRHTLQYLEKRGNMYWNITKYACITWSFPNSHMFMNELLKTRHCIVAIYLSYRKTHPCHVQAHTGVKVWHSYFIIIMKVTLGVIIRFFTKLLISLLEFVPICKKS